MESEKRGGQGRGKAEKAHVISRRATETKKEEGEREVSCWGKQVCKGGLVGETWPALIQNLSAFPEM